MELLIQLIILFFSLAILSKSSHIVTENSAKLAKISGLGERTIGFFVLSLASSAPEIAIAFSAIVTKNIGITLGNIFGSNVANILLVVGVMAILTKIKIYEETVKKLSRALFLTSVIPLLLLGITSYSTIIGLFLIFVFIIFFYFSARERITIKEFVERGKEIKLSLVLSLALSLFFLLISSRFVVDSAFNISRILNISETIIGASIISIGSVLPELVVGIGSVKKKYIGLALGTTIGSCVVKVTVVLGFVLLLAPLLVDLTLFSVLIAFMIFSAILFLFLSLRRVIGKIEGIVLLFFYFFFLFTIVKIGTVFF